MIEIHEDEILQVLVISNVLLYAVRQNDLIKSDLIPFEFSKIIYSSTLREINYRINSF